MQSKINNSSKKKEQKLRVFLINGGLITACSLILRSISVSFNVYVANTAGAEAVGLYTLLSGVFGFAVTLALSGINLALTRLLSEALALKNIARAKRTIRACFCLALIFGFFACFLLLTFAKPLSMKYLLEPRAEKPLRILALCLPPLALSSVFNGYFTAVRRAYKNALVALGEMTAKILFTFFFFSRIAPDSPELACIALVLGGVLAEFCSFAINLSLYIFEKLRKPIGSKGSATNTPSVYKSILSISMPVALTSYVRSALLSLEHSLIPKGLYRFGQDKSGALASYGILSGMALPIINFPYALIGSFTSLLIPEVAESHAKGHEGHVRYITHRTYQACLSFAFCISGIFFVFADELGTLFYSSAEAGTYIRLLSLLAPIMYADTSTDAILKGLGEQLHCMKVNIADSLLSVILVCFLVPRYGIMGYIATIYIAESVNVLLSISRLLRISRFKFPFKKTILSPLFCAVGSGAIYRLFANAFPVGISTLHTALGIIFFSFIYFALINLTCTFSRDDVNWLLSILKK